MFLQILFHTANNSDVAHQWITVTPDLFDVYKVPDLEVECSVRLKVCGCICDSVCCSSKVIKADANVSSLVVRLYVRFSRRLLQTTILCLFF